MTRPPRILFFADSGARVGGGHVMRCLTLARALAARGAMCAFLAPPAAAAVLAAFGPGIDALPTPEAPLAQTIAALAEHAGVFGADWLVLDHYGLNRDYEATLRASGLRLMTIDDLANRTHDCDLLLDPSHGREARDYEGLIPAPARILFGPRYALVRPEFSAARDRALARRGASDPGRVLVSLGLTDVDAITTRAVEALRPMLGDMRVDVVLSAAAPSLGPLQALDDPRLTLHIDSHAMAALMTDADLAIGAGGSSAWERACLGLPAVTLILADNQRALAQRMDAEGLTLAVEAFKPGFARRFVEAFERLAGDETLRRSMSSRLAALCDGLGVERIAEAMSRPPGRHGS